MRNEGDDMEGVHMGGTNWWRNGEGSAWAGLIGRKCPHGWD